MAERDKASIAFITSENPFPPLGGNGLRMAATCRALADVGELERLVLISRGSSATVVGPDGREWSVVGSSPATAVDSVRSSVLSLAGWRPGRANVLDWARARNEIDSLCGDVDVVWVYGDRTALAVSRRLRRSARVVVDLVDSSAQRNLDISGVQFGRQPLKRILARADARAERRFHRRIARRADVVLISSEVDRRALSIPATAVLPNSYDRGDAPVGSTRSSAASGEVTVLIAGSFGYVPNRHGTEWLRNAVWPLVRSREPRAALRIVGRHSRTHLHDDPAQGITVVGSVPEMGPELARADVVAVPLHIASGTRLKIIEAWAHRVPVVSTTKGAEGLGAVDGVNVLLADDPEQFADALLRVVNDPNLAAALVDAGERQWAQQHSPSVADAVVGDVLAELVSQ